MSVTGIVVDVDAAPNVPEPDTILHEPVPIDGVDAVNVTLPSQLSVFDGPVITAALGKSFVIVTVAELLQPFLLIVQRKTLPP